ncbi:MAG: SH3 domain-containing protein, partial [Kofleriaceae bacterium]
MLGLACVYVAVTCVTVAHGEPRRTLAVVSLRAKPGERAAVVARLAANTVVHVLATEGRWLRVRASSVEGYLTRTTVSASPEAAVPVTPWRAARTVDGAVTQALFVEVVAARATLRAQPRPEAAPVIELARGARLVVIDATSDPAWIHAHDPAGHDGWIHRPEIDNGASAVAVTGVDLRGLGLAREVAAPPRATGALGLRVELGLGFRTLGMSLTSNA